MPALFSDKYPLLICAWNILDYCSKRYPKRQVIADSRIQDDHFIYYTQKGEMRACIKKVKIYKPGKNNLERIR